MTIGARTACDGLADRATPTHPNPACAVCGGSGVDRDFNSDCTECWPTGPRISPQLRGRIGFIVPVPPSKRERLNIPYKPRRESVQPAGWRRPTTSEKLIAVGLAVLTIIHIVG